MAGADEPANDRDPLLALALLVYTGAFAMAELIGANWLGRDTFLNAQDGANLALFVDYALLGILLVHGAIASAVQRIASSRLLFGLTLVPLARIVSLSVPQHPPLDPWVTLFIQAFVLVIALLVLVLVRGTTWDELGLRRGTRMAAPMGAVAVRVAVVAGFAEAKAAGGGDGTLPSGGLGILAVLGVLLGTAVFQELLFRGLLLQRASRIFGGGAAILLLALLEAVLHLGSHSVAVFLLALGTGIVFGLVTRASKSVWGAMVSHAVLNVVALWIAPRL
jgi:membrane protease YdiL (CAAX protease family)